MMVKIFIVTPPRRKIISEHLCMFKEMAWLDESLNFDNVTAEADVLSLPANVNINTNLQTVYNKVSKYLHSV